MAMTPAPFVYVAVMVACLVSFVVSPWVASRKGYAPYFWMFAAGPLGLAIISLLPSIKAAKTPEMLELMQARTNTTGAILSGVTLLLAVMLFVPVLLLGI